MGKLNSRVSKLEKQNGDGQERLRPVRYVTAAERATVDLAELGKRYFLIIENRPGKQDEH